MDIDKTHESKLIKSILTGKHKVGGRDNGRARAVYLIDGTKISIGRDGYLGAWLEIGSTPTYSHDDTKSEEKRK